MSSRRMFARNEENLGPVKTLTEVTRQNMKQLINIEKFSSYHRLLRITAYVLRFVRRQRQKMKMVKVI